VMNVTPLPRSEVTKFLTDDPSLCEYECGRISTPDFYHCVLERLKLDVSLENFRRLWADIFLPEPLISESFLAALKKNYRLILLSNTNEIHYEFIMQKYPILRHIEEHVLSFQVGSMKPEGQIYQFAIEKAGVPAEEIFFTDDRIENVEAAKLAGLQAVQFRSEEHLKREMIKLGISLHD
jgi:FMN phosphatase YigB (HAD superfamily)